jgi:hypothetical protein
LAIPFFGQIGLAAMAYVWDVAVDFSELKIAVVDLG